MIIAPLFLAHKIPADATLSGRCFTLFVQAGSAQGEL